MLYLDELVTRSDRALKLLVNWGHLKFTNEDKCFIRKKQTCFPMSIKPLFSPSSPLILSTLG